MKGTIFCYCHQTDKQNANRIAKSTAYFILKNSASILSTFSKTYKYEKDSSASECFVFPRPGIQPNATNQILPGYQVLWAGIPNTKCCS
jgi:hypothetical protein